MPKIILFYKYLVILILISSFQLNAAKNNNNKNEIIKSNSSNIEDLDAIYSLAKHNDQTLQAAIATYHAILFNLPISISEILPQINLDGQWTKTTTILSDNINNSNNINNNVANNNLSTPNFNSLFVGGTNKQRIKEYDLTLDQVLFNLENFVDIFQAKSQMLQAFFNLETARQDLITRVVTNYFKIKSEEQNLILLVAEKKAVAKQLEQAQERFKVGVSAKTDVDTAQARYDSIVTEKISAENSLENSKDELSIITNKKTENLADLTKSNLKLFNPLDYKVWVKKAIEKNPNLHSQKIETNIQSQNVTKKFSGHFPTLDYSAEKSRNNTLTIIKNRPDPDIITKTLSHTITLDLPILAGGNTVFSTKQAKYNYDASNNNFELALRTIITNTKISYRACITKYKEIQSQKVAVTSAESSYQSTLAGFEVGTRNIVNVLDSISELYRQKRILATNRYEYLVNITILKQNSGSLEDKDILEINKLLEY
tara:strand:- start:9121 stop:10578 length:1458 start_codon:yes stop_codon:yes gene_type:complete